MISNENTMTIEQIRDSTIRNEDLIKSLGKVGVLIKNVVYPFYFEISIADAVSKGSSNFPEMQNTQLKELNLESDGLITINDTNLLQFLKGSSSITLNGKFGLQVPTDSVFPLDFVPKITYSNSSGSTRILAFYGWLAPYPR